MFQRVSVGGFRGGGVGWNGGKWVASLPLRLTFGVSAYKTARQMIQFSDKKGSVVFLFLGIILSNFGIRGDRILFILGGQVQPIGSVSCP